MTITDRTESRDVVASKNENQKMNGMSQTTRKYKHKDLGQQTNRHNNCRMVPA